ncbi:MAG: carboxypeptidase-like regulatory domain-containing protein [Bacteroidetes bacterium]|nr:carboxypeptidase-like regulatory domain-containing protein [Bacteroidota bacterium]
MEESNNRNQYSATDIQKYLEGKLSPTEMHAMEKAALEDPFLADAIEGMQGTGNDAFNKGAEELKVRLEKRIHQKENKGLILGFKSWQRMAAAIIILIGGVTVIYNYTLSGRNNENKVAVQKEKTVVDSVIPGNNKTVIAADSIAAGSVAINDKKTESPKSISRERAALPSVRKEEHPEEVKSESEKKQVAVASAAKMAPVTDHETNKKTDIIIEADSVKSNADIAGAAPVNSLQGKIPGVVITKSRSSNNRFIQGKVVDNNNQPISGATVTLKGKKTGTSTDANGLFKLNSNSHDTITNVVVNSIGYETADVALNNNTTNNKVKLQPNNSPLSEVVVTGYGIKKDDDDYVEPGFDKKEKEPFYKAEPTIGWDAFNDYINGHKKINTADSLIKGKEIISFMVDSSNQLSSFKIKKSLSPTHDAEAIRLVKEGPTWKLLRKKKARITLAIKF